MEAKPPNGSICTLCLSKLPYQTTSVVNSPFHFRETLKRSWPVATPNLDVRVLLLHDSTRQALESFLAKPSHALLLSGLAGSGKALVATHTVAALLKLDINSIVRYPYFLHIEPHNETISIEATRSLRRFVSLKTPGKQSIRRAIIISDAQAMTIEAQNAFLKLLEEPPQDTVLILTATSSNALLSTIRSRLQSVAIQKVALDSATSFFQTLGKHVTNIEHAYRMSNGRVGIMYNLLQNSDQQPLIADMRVAKQFLSMSSFERLSYVSVLAQNKEQLPRILSAIEHICHIGLAEAANQGKTTTIKRWLHLLKISYQAFEQLDHNPNPQLLLTHLALQV
jgi:hypothetical protein